MNNVLLCLLSYFGSDKQIRGVAAIATAKVVRLADSVKELLILN
jgi:hypothetical protein